MITPVLTILTWPFRFLRRHCFIDFCDYEYADAEDVDYRRCRRCGVVEECEWEGIESGWTRLNPQDAKAAELRYFRPRFD
jgi:hypothetical protein